MTLEAMNKAELIDRFRSLERDDKMLFENLLRWSDFYGKTLNWQRTFRVEFEVTIDWDQKKITGLRLVGQKITKEIQRRRARR